MGRPLDAIAGPGRLRPSLHLRHPVAGGRRARRRDRGVALTAPGGEATADRRPWRRSRVGARSAPRLQPAQGARSPNTVRIQSPAGTRHSIDYSAPAGPTVEVRAQALFGLASHPAVADGAVPLVLAITSPAGRPIQTTRDLPAFWSGSWREVAKEMRGRYPKHPWPDDPAGASPTLRTKRSSASQP